MPRISRSMGYKIFTILFMSISIAGMLSGQTCNSKFPAVQNSKAGACAKPQPDISINTQGDSATPTAIPVPLTKSNNDAVTIEIGPLSPVESCSLTSMTSVPSTTTDEASLARMIAALLGTSIAAPTIPSGAPTNTKLGITGSWLPNTSNQNKESCESSPLATLLSDAEDELNTANDNFNSWSGRRQAALDALNVGQRLLTLAARTPIEENDSTKEKDSTVKRFLDNCKTQENSDCILKLQIRFLADCLNEEVASCGKDQDAVPNQQKLDAEGALQRAATYLASAANLLKTVLVEPACENTPKSNGGKRNKEQTEESACKAKKAQYECDKDNFNSLQEDQGQLVALQNEDTKLRAGEANLTAVYAQVYKVLQHVNSKNIQLDSSGNLYESLTITPSEDSDLGASVTCTSVLDNSTTLGPVPITVHTGIPHLIFSAGGLVSLTRTQTLGEVPVSDTSTTPPGVNTVIAQTGENRFQVIPFAFETFRFLPWKESQLNSYKFLGFGITGGIGFNPYSGVTGIDFFSGGSIRVMDKIYLHLGAHSGRYVYLDKTSGFETNKPLPSGFPTTVPTVTRFTHHLAFGASYSF